MTKVKNWAPSSFFSQTEKARNQDWKLLDTLGQALCEKYAWAVPDKRALCILKNFSPLIEIGSGKGYWARLLQDEGADLLPFDKYCEGVWTKVHIGGPEVLSKKKYNGRNLFLCYPDESESIAATCVENFQGEYIVHVGEHIMNSGTNFGPPQVCYRFLACLLACYLISLLFQFFLCP